MKHTIQALVENKFGVLARVASLFSARGYNITSLAVGETEDPTMSRMTIVVDAEDERVLEQIKKQLHKLIDVVTVVDITRKGYIDRELVLLKVPKKAATKKSIDAVLKKFPVRRLCDKKGYVTLEICADHHQVESVFKALETAGIKEVIRTGKIAITG